MEGKGFGGFAVNIGGSVPQHAALGVFFPYQIWQIAFTAR
jgi:hypothetical protein